MHMPSFSIRNGFEAPRTVIQVDGIDLETRVMLWNVLAVLRRQYETYEHRESHRAFTELIWTSFLKRPLDEAPYDSIVWASVKEYTLSGQLNEVFDLVEFFSKRLTLGATQAQVFRRAVNQVFVTYLVGYRIIGEEIAPIHSAVDVEAVTSALEATNSIPAARHHLTQALELLSSRDSPDYPNSVKESISAVESVARLLTSTNTLGEALKNLATNGVEVHPALERAWSAMYGWTSNEGGIRHGAHDVAKIDQALAKYMLFACSAFVSLLIESGRIAGKL